MASNITIGKSCHSSPDILQISAVQTSAFAIQWKFVLERIKMCVTSEYTNGTGKANWLQSIELAESFLLASF